MLCELILDAGSEVTETDIVVRLYGIPTLSPCHPGQTVAGLPL